MLYNMRLIPITDPSDYKKSKEATRATYYKCTKRNIKKFTRQIVSSQETTANALVTKLTELQRGNDQLQRRNDQMDILQQTLFYQAQIDQPAAESAPKKETQRYIDLDIKIKS